MKKKLFAAIAAFSMAFVMAFSMAACGGSGEAEPAEVEQKEATEVAEDVYSTKTMAYFREYLVDGAYTMESKYDMDGLEVVSFVAVDGNQMYSRTTMDGMESILILLEDAQYILDPASKLAIKMEIGADGGGLNMQEMFAEEEENYETAVSYGDMEVNGKNCFYEEFTVEDSSVKYCFDGNDLKYILTEMDGIIYTMEIVHMEKGADADLFVLPDDYEVMAF
ncbi:MAG: hypothetical protein Q4C06_06650 [Bacillota bacterium]|nr:hypothetical protein [Bacillota bacterium]